MFEMVYVVSQRCSSGVTAFPKMFEIPHDSSQRCSSMTTALPKMFELVHDFSAGVDEALKQCEINAVLILPASRRAQDAFEG
jgi:hypothetical protein